MTLPAHKMLRRALALTLVFGTCGLAYGAVVPLFDDYRATTESIDQMAELLGRYQKLAQNLPQAEAELARIKQQKDAQGGFFKASSDTLVAAQMQGKVRTAVESAQASLKSTQVLPTQVEGGMRRITLRGQMVSNLAAAQRILYDLEASSPYLFIDNVSLRVRPGDRRAEGSGVDPLLDVRFDVSGYMPGEAK